MEMHSPCKVVVLIGGSGSNLQALINHAPTLPIAIECVISHRPEAYGLIRAQNANLKTVVIDHKQYSRETFENELAHTIHLHRPDLVVLAGFMRLLSPLFVKTFADKIINIHPSLLPKFKGLNTHQRVLEAGEKQHGVSVHFVTEELDGGPIIAQVSVPVLPQDDAASLGARVLRAEHWLYPQVVGWYAQKRLKCAANIVTLDSKQIAAQGMQLLLPLQQGMVS